MITQLKSQNTDTLNCFYPGTLDSQFVCKYCGGCVMAEDSSPTPLYHHLLAAHPDRLILKKKQNMNKPKITEPEEEQISDEWLDRLALNGYPVQQIISSILMRYKEDSISFAKYISRRASSLLTCKYRVKNFLPRLPLTLLPEEIEPLLMDKYRISKEGARLLMKDHFWCYQGQDQVFHQLDQRGITIKQLNGEDKSELTVMYTQAMKQNYHKFGDGFNIYLREVLFNQMPRSSYFVILLLGQDSDAFPTLFGLIFVSKLVTQLIINGLKQFFNGLERPPESIIIHSQQLIQPVQQFAKKLSSNYMLNWQSAELHFRSIRNQSSISLSIFTDLLSSVSEVELQGRLKEMELKYQTKSLQAFQAKAYLYSMARAKPKFIGFGIEPEANHLITKIVNRQLSKADDLGILVLRCIRLEENLMKRLVRGYNIMDGSEMQRILKRKIDYRSELHYLRRRMEKTVFNKLLQTYLTAKNRINMIDVAPTQYQVYFKVPGPLYTVKYSCSSGCWKCNCKLIYFSGLPCCHLMKVIGRCGGLISYYVDRRWLISSNSFNPDTILVREETSLRSQCD